MANIVFGWLGYDLWNAENEEEVKLQESSNSWIWVEQDGDTLSQDDLEFHERKQQKCTPLLSYADAVRASFERCKRDEKAEKVRKESCYNTMVKKIANGNLAEEKLLRQNTDPCLSERFQMKMKTDSKRKFCSRYQPFPKNQKVSFLERENITNYVLDRQIIPYNSGRITLVNFVEHSASIPLAKSNSDGHWITVGKEKCSFKPVHHPKVPKMRFVVDVSDNNCITILRMAGDQFDVDCPREQKLKDICTIVDDVKYDRKVKFQRESAGSVQVLCFNRMDNSSGVKDKSMVKNPKRKIRVTERRRDKKNRQSAHMTSCTNAASKKRCIEFAIEQNIIPLQYLLGIQHQPLSIEWPNRTISKDSPNSIFDGFKFMEGVFNGILSIALSLSQIEMGNFNELCDYDEPEKVQEDAAPRKKGPSKRKVIPRATRGKRDIMKTQVYNNTDFAMCKRKKKKWCEFINANKAPRNHPKINKKSRNLTPKRFSGRGGARGR